MRVLVIDDEKNIRVTLSVCLESLGCTTLAVGHAEAAIEALEQEHFDLAFLDLRLDRANGLDVLPRLLAVRSQLAVVIVTAHATFETAVQAIKRGASDYLPKPFTPAQIRHVVDKLAHVQAMASRLSNLENQLAVEVPEADLNTRSHKMRALLDLVGRAAVSDATVLLRGESGTGKGVVARTLHLQSRRCNRPFMTINCPTLSEDLLASELFGHTRGAFTGAIKDQEGRVEAAEGGTLFLDEIGEISSGLQAKLLRFVQEKQFERVGDNRTRRADVRVVSATNRNIEQDVKDGRFREDLLFRLNVIEAQVPSLRHRPEDIVPLAHRFLRFFGRTAGRADLELTPDAEAALAAYQWPGNVRELRNVMERAVILWPANMLTPDAFPEQIAKHATQLAYLGGNFTLEQIERAHILGVMQHHASQDETAQVLGVDVSTLWRKRKRYFE